MSMFSLRVNAQLHETALNRNELNNLQRNQCKQEMAHVAYTL